MKALWYSANCGVLLNETVERLIIKILQPMKPKLSKEEIDKDMSNNVHFAYSVTLLHHSCIIHCVTPGIPWFEAKVIRPTFKLYGGNCTLLCSALYSIYFSCNNLFLDHHMMVFIPGYFTHLLDIGISHEPCCHIMIPMKLQPAEDFQMKLVPLFDESDLVINLNTLEVFPLVVTTQHLTDTFKNETHLDNRLSIIHYLLVHLFETDVITEVIIYKFF